MNDPYCPDCKDQTCLCNYYVAPRTRRETRKVLTDAGIAALEPRAKQFKIFDGGNLYLSVQVTGNKTWFYKYNERKPLVGQGGGEHHVPLGTWPNVRVAEARARRDLAKRLVAMGEYPTQRWIKDLRRDTKLMEALSDPRATPIVVDQIRAYAAFARDSR